MWAILVKLVRRTDSDPQTGRIWSPCHRFDPLIRELHVAWSIWLSLGFPPRMKCFKASWDAGAPRGCTGETLAMWGDMGGDGWCTWTRHLHAARDSRRRTQLLIWIQRCELMTDLCQMLYLLSSHLTFLFFAHYLFCLNIMILPCFLVNLHLFHFWLLCFSVSRYFYHYHYWKCSSCTFLFLYNDEWILMINVLCICLNCELLKQKGKLDR